MSSAAVMGGFTLLSRILGLVRDQVIAWLLGTGIQADAYGVAIKLPNLFRRLMGEGAMAAAYVPVLSGLLAQAEGDERRKAKVWEFVSRFAMFFTLALVVLTLAGVILSPWVVRFVAPGFDVKGDAAAFDVTVRLNRIVFPYLFFVCLAALAMGTLNALGSFGPPAFTPILLNLSIIGCAVFLHRAFSLPVYALGVGYLAGGVLQVLWQIPFLWKRGGRLRMVSPRPDAHVLGVGRRMGIGAFGAGIYQINVLVGTMVASSLPRGSIASLYYADRINELILGVWAVSVATVVLPSLSRLVTAGRSEEAEEMLGLGLRQVLFLTLPAALALALLAEPIVGTLFHRGAFDRDSLDLTVGALRAYALGLPAIGGARVMVSSFYARGDVPRAVAMAALSFAANLAFLALFYEPLAHQGVALAGSLAAWTSFVGLIIWHRGVHGGVGGKSLFPSVLRTGGGAAFMAWALWMVMNFVDVPARGWSGLVFLTWVVPLGVVSHIGFCWILGSREPSEFLGLLEGRGGRRR